VFRLLADYYQERARLARQVMADLAYPVILFHLAIFIFPFAQWFASGKTLAYLGQTFGILLPVYAVVVLGLYAGQGRHGESWRALIEQLLDPVPVLGVARRCLALSRLAGALEALISAGVTIAESWELAAAASGSPAFRRIVQTWRPALRAGNTPADLVNSSSRFPQLFANQYATGEVSGKLDETLKRLHNYYLEEGTRKLHAVAQWAPRALYALIAIMIGWRVVSFWSDYFQQIQNAGKI
jgi:type II secretory pathway component PulF